MKELGYGWILASQAILYAYHFARAVWTSIVAVFPRSNYRTDNGRKYMVCRFETTPPKFLATSRRNLSWRYWCVAARMEELGDTGVLAFQTVIWSGFLAGAKWTSVPVCTITDIGLPDMCVTLSALPPERLFAGIDDVAGLDLSVTPWQLPSSNAILRIPGTVVFRGRV